MLVGVGMHQFDEKERQFIGECRNTNFWPLLDVVRSNGAFQTLLKFHEYSLVEMVVFRGKVIYLNIFLNKNK